MTVLVKTSNTQRTQHHPPQHLKTQKHNIRIRLAIQCILRLKLKNVLSAKKEL